ncbi:MAG TPA: YqhR family membrane protein [Bacillota bacterium]|nr:YqhR family membrane protein [Bacillota bacterium]
MTEERTNIKAKKIRSAVSVGASGGLFWSFVCYLLHFLNFTSIGPSVLIQPFWDGMGHRPLAHILGMGVAAILGILFAVIYVFTMSKFYQPFIGVAYGIVLFAIFFYLFNPIFSLTNKPIHQMGINTFATMLCLFVLFGLFIGFSLSVEFSSKEGSAKVK